MDKEDTHTHTHTYTHTHLYNGILLSHKEEDLPFVSTQMDLKGTMKYARGREIMHDIIYIWNLKTTTN